MRFTLHTTGHTEFINITHQVEQEVRHSNVRDGIAVIFAKHTTVAVAILDDEEGLKSDIRRTLEKIAPAHGHYEHNSPGDDNGAAHIRSALMGTDLTVPIENGKLALGTWQRIFFIDFDNRPREREISVTAMGE